MADVGRALQDAAERISSSALEAGSPAVPGGTDGTILLWRRVATAQRVRAAAAAVTLHKHQPCLPGLLVAVRSSLLDPLLIDPPANQSHARLTQNCGIMTPRGFRAAKGDCEFHSLRFQAASSALLRCLVRHCLVLSGDACPNRRQKRNRKTGKTGVLLPERPAVSGIPVHHRAQLAAGVH